MTNQNDKANTADRPIELSCGCAITRAGPGEWVVSRGCRRLRRITASYEATDKLLAPECREAIRKHLICQMAKDTDRYIQEQMPRRRTFPDRDDIIYLLTVVAPATLALGYILYLYFS